MNGDSILIKKMFLVMFLIIGNYSFAMVNEGELIKAEKINEITFGVGDIRQSLLEVNTFQSRYGNCWRLMDGSSASGTDYESIKR